MSSTRPLSTAVVVPRGGLRRWHVDALNRSVAAGLIRLDAVIESRRTVRRVRELSLDLLAAVESTRGRIARPLRSGCRAREEWPGIEILPLPRDARGATPPSRRWDLIVNLDGPEATDRLQGKAGRGILELWLGDSNDAADLLDAFRSRGQTLEISALLVTDERTFEIARSVAAARGTLLILRSLERLLARASVVLSRAIGSACARGDAGVSAPLPRGRSAVAPPAATAAFGFLLFAVSDYARAVFRGTTSEPDGWFLAYRESAEHFVANTLAFSPQGLTAIMPPPGHFYSDPCVFAQDGADHVFFEDYDRAAAQGVIAWMQRVSPGTFTRPETVLHCPYHVSYPQVFEHEGAIYMVPETAQARRVQLYRARVFPREWELVAVLLDDVNAVDATLLCHDGRWWMFTNIGEAESSTWDELFAFYADSPLGPWKPHAANPVKSDVRSARPAGRFFRHRGRLIRPAQNCSRSYGGSLALCEVLELTPARYRERVVAELGPEWMPGNLGFHTLSFSDRLEFIDGKIDAAYRSARGSCLPSPA
jgi:hypothetical protein